MGHAVNLAQLKRLVAMAERSGHFDAYLKESVLASGPARNWFLEHRSSR